MFFKKWLVTKVIVCSLLMFGHNIHAAKVLSQENKEKLKQFSKDLGKRAPAHFIGKEKGTWCQTQRAQKISELLKTQTQQTSSQHSQQTSFQAPSQKSNDTSYYSNLLTAQNIGRATAGLCIAAAYMYSGENLSNLYNNLMPQIDTSTLIAAGTFSLYQFFDSFFPQNTLYNCIGHLWNSKKDVIPKQEIEVDGQIVEEKAPELSCAECKKPFVNSKNYYENPDISVNSDNLADENTYYHNACIINIIKSSQYTPENPIYFYSLNDLTSLKENSHKKIKPKGTVWPHCANPQCSTHFFTNNSDVIIPTDHGLFHSCCFEKSQNNTPTYTYTFANFEQKNIDAPTEAQISPGCLYCSQSIQKSASVYIINALDEKNCSCLNMFFYHKNCLDSALSNKSINLICHSCNTELKGDAPFINLSIDEKDGPKKVLEKIEENHDGYVDSLPKRQLSKKRMLTPFTEAKTPDSLSSPSCSPHHTQPNSPTTTLSNHSPLSPLSSLSSEPLPLKSGKNIVLETDQPCESYEKEKVKELELQKKILTSHIQLGKRQKSLKQKHQELKQYLPDKVNKSIVGFIGDLGSRLDKFDKHTTGLKLEAIYQLQQNIFEEQQQLMKKLVETEAQIQEQERQRIKKERAIEETKEQTNIIEQQVKRQRLATIAVKDQLERRQIQQQAIAIQLRQQQLAHAKQQVEMQQRRIAIEAHARQQQALEFQRRQQRAYGSHQRAYGSPQTVPMLIEE